MKGGATPPCRGSRPGRAGGPQSQPGGRRPPLPPVCASMALPVGGSMQLRTIVNHAHKVPGFVHGKIRPL